MSKRTKSKLCRYPLDGNKTCTKRTRDSSGRCHLHQGQEPVAQAQHLSPAAASDVVPASQNPYAAWSKPGYANLTFGFSDGADDMDVYGEHDAKHTPEEVLVKALLGETYDPLLLGYVIEADSERSEPLIVSEHIDYIMDQDNAFYSDPRVSALHHPNASTEALLEYRRHSFTMPFEVEIIDEVLTRRGI